MFPSRTRYYKHRQPVNQETQATTASASHVITFSGGTIPIVSSFSRTMPAVVPAANQSKNAKKKKRQRTNKAARKAQEARANLANKYAQVVPAPQQLSQITSVSHNADKGESTQMPRQEMLTQEDKATPKPLKQPLKFTFLEGRQNLLVTRSEYDPKYKDKLKGDPSKYPEPSVTLIPKKELQARLQGKKLEIKQNPEPEIAVMTDDLMFEFLTTDIKIQPQSQPPSPVAFSGFSLQFTPDNDAEDVKPDARSPVPHSPPRLHPNNKLTQALGSLGDALLVRHRGTAYRTLNGSGTKVNPNSIPAKSKSQPVSEDSSPCISPKQGGFGGLFSSTPPNNSQLRQRKIVSVSLSPFNKKS